MRKGRVGGKRPSGRAVPVTVLFLILGPAVGAASYTGCGRLAVSHRIVGGASSSLCRWPWMCSLAYNNRHVCGASLLTPKLAITAAHCVQNKDVTKMNVMAGMLNLTNPGPTSAVYAVESVTSHSDFQQDGDSGDVALIKLKTPATFNSCIQPICLPGSDQIFPNGQMCILTGWGYTSEDEKLESPYTMREVPLPVMDHVACDRMFRETYPDTYQDQVKSNMLCAGYASGGKDGCQGDSGGPLACEDDDTWFLAGVMSWGVGCGIPNSPGVFTKVSSFINWINQNSDIASTTSRTIRIPTNSTTSTIRTPNTTTSTTTRTPGTTNTTSSTTTSTIRTPNTTTSNTTRAPGNTNTTTKTPGSPNTTTRSLGTITTRIPGTTNTTTRTPGTTNTTTRTPGTTTAVKMDSLSTMKPEQAATGGQRPHLPTPSLVVVALLFTKIPEMFFAHFY